MYLKHMEPPLRYPSLARSARVQGTVVVKVKIAADGSVLSMDFQPGDGQPMSHPILREATERLVKGWTFGCANCESNTPFEATLKFEYRLRSGSGLPYDDTTVVMNLPGEIIITASPRECDHCPVENPEWCKPLPRPEYKTLERGGQRCLV